MYTGWNALVRGNDVVLVAVDKTGHITYAFVDGSWPLEEWWSELTDGLGLYGKARSYTV